MTKSVAGHAASALRATGAATTATAKAATGALGVTVPSWSGYWNFVAATIILAFVLYTAQKGTLMTWVGFFGWSPQAAPTTTTAAAAAPATGAVGAAVSGINSAVNSTGLGSAITGLTGVPPLSLGIVPGSPAAQILAGPTANSAAPATTPGQANPIPGLSSIGAWLKSITGVGQ